MKVDEAKYSIAEIVDWYKNKELVANKDYQRGTGIWPKTAESYFIDTILKEFPFPKVYFHEHLDKKTRKPMREIVDGQQRIAAIVKFVDGGFALGKNAKGHEGQKFDDLAEDIKESFFSYTISVDVIRNANRSDILQMFRRMNAYTLPLNPAEKRQGEFFGEFKDWVNTILDEYGSILVNWKVFTGKQIIRLADAEFIADLALAVDQGIVSTSPTSLFGLYKKYDADFNERGRFDENIRGAFNVLSVDFSEIQSTYLTRPHILHSLLCALIHNRHGLPGAQEAIGVAPIGQYYVDRGSALEALKRLATAHEEKDTMTYREYVQAASEGGNRINQRKVRVKYLCQALLGELP
ncbi:DUF262 domain-containing protein [Azospirillum sp. TSH64]|uniref:DUF262 domain-containing protein n=1 Tax=Azospirillum sp. TSH64 TaxID=652740 RepID=UPI000D658BE0|nr:DUF262 domain-containing protein [Azospirillum sp. TSH64]